MNILAGILIINSILIIFLGIRVYSEKIDFFADILNRDVSDTISSKTIAICLISAGMFILIFSIVGIILYEKSLIFIAAAAILLSILTITLHSTDNQNKNI